jgi:glycosyltransferase involved in cell wall biosynthesis
MPKIFTITISFNNANGLKQTMDSFFTQTFADYEYIIIDGDSNDESVKLIEEYRYRFAYSVSGSDGGIYFAMNKGIAKAKGNYLMFLNTGDYLLDNNVLSYARSLTKKKKQIFIMVILLLSQIK